MPLSLPRAAHFKKSTPNLSSTFLSNESNFKIVFMDCSARQPQSMAAIPTFTGDGGPILSLTGKQRTELADFSRAAARAHSTLRCTASPHGPLRVAYSNFGSPWASCSHLVFAYSSQFASFFFVHLPLCFRLTPHITQRVPTSFQQRACAVNTYPTIRFKYMSSLSLFSLP